jgi:long-chain acyl-CoA synthetase
MQKWVLPTLEEELKIQEKRSLHIQGPARPFRHASQTISDARRDADRAKRRKEQYTFEDVRELTLRPRVSLRKNGIKHGDRVILFSNNMPEWGMTYFGILKAVRPRYRSIRRARSMRS